MLPFIGAAHKFVEQVCQTLLWVNEHGRTQVPWKKGTAKIPIMKGEGKGRPTLLFFEANGEWGYRAQTLSSRRTKRKSPRPSPYQISLLRKFGMKIGRINESGPRH
jgi:hypothetical protein